MAMRTAPNHTWQHALLLGMSASTSALPRCQFAIGQVSAERPPTFRHTVAEAAVLTGNVPEDPSFQTGVSHTDREGFAQHMSNVFNMNDYILIWTEFT